MNHKEIRVRLLIQEVHSDHNRVSSALMNRRNKKHDVQLIFDQFDSLCNCDLYVVNNTIFETVSRFKANPFQEPLDIAFKKLFT